MLDPMEPCAPNAIILSAELEISAVDADKLYRILQCEDPEQLLAMSAHTRYADACHPGLDAMGIHLRAATNLLEGNVRASSETEPHRLPDFHYIERPGRPTLRRDNANGLYGTWSVLSADKD